MAKPDEMKFLPIGIQDFETMIRGDFLYVDKTRFIHEMARPLQAFFFLARPRRFGKSLLVSTLAALFSGKRELFENLWISESDWEWASHPVVKVDFTQMSFETPEELDASLLNFIEQTARKHDIPLSIRQVPDAFTRLITGLGEKSGRPVVVLIDEYDKPIIDHLGRGEAHLEIARQNRDRLKRFFGVLKGGDVSAALRFVLITGISKFARVSIFSDLNNLNDISMDARYADLLGYSEAELVDSFAPFMERMAVQTGADAESFLGKIRSWYDGYRFSASDQTVYNPFSILQLFQKQRFANYWFETATPSFLVHLIREKNYSIPDIETICLPAEWLSAYDLDRLQLEPLLFQTGYITIRTVEDDLFHLGYPNREVKNAFTGLLFSELAAPEDARLAGEYKRLGKFLRDGEIESFIETVQAILAGIPYSQIAGQGEAFYHTAFYLMLTASGAAVHTEVLTSRGRIDLAVEFPDQVIVIELKCNQDADAAIRQILERRYFEKYIASGRDIFLMGLNFDTDERTIRDWRWGRPEDFSEIPIPGESEE